MRLNSGNQSNQFRNKYIRSCIQTFDERDVQKQPESHAAQSGELDVSTTTDAAKLRPDWPERN